MVNTEPRASQKASQGGSPGARWAVSPGEFKGSGRELVPPYRTFSPQRKEFILLNGAILCLCDGMFPGGFVEIRKIEMEAGNVKRRPPKMVRKR